MPPNPSFPQRAPVGLLSGLILSVFATLLVFAGWHHLSNPLQRFYFKPYVTSAFRPSRSLNKRPVSVLYPIVVRDEGQVAIRLTSMTPSAFHDWAKRNVYHDRTIGQILAWPLGFSFVVTVILISIGASRDSVAKRKAREGTQTRGPRLLTVSEFNSEVKGDGLALRVNS